MYAVIFSILYYQTWKHLSKFHQTINMPEYQRFHFCYYISLQETKQKIKKSPWWFHLTAWRFFLKFDFYAYRHGFKHWIIYISLQKKTETKFLKILFSFLKVWFLCLYRHNQTINYLHNNGQKIKNQYKSIYINLFS